MLVFSALGFSFRACVSSSPLISHRLLLVPLLLLLSSSRLFLLPLLCLFFLLFFALGSFLSPLLLCLSLRLLLTRLRSPSLIPLSSAFLSLAPLGGGGEVGSSTMTVLPESSWVVSMLVWGLLNGFSSLCSVPPAVASGSSSLPPLASLLAPSFPVLWVCGSKVVLYSGCFSWVVLASGSSAFLPSLFLCLRSSASVLCSLRIL